MPYATAQDMLDRFGDATLKQVTDPDGQQIDETALARALQDASDEIDGYLESRYRLPLNPQPRILRNLACNIAMYQLMVLRPLGDISDARKRYEDAIALLMKVAEGKVQLGLSDSEQPAAPAGGSVVAGPERTFSRDRLTGF